METQRTAVPDASLAKDKKGITGSTLKIIAVVTMLIDHIGAVIMERFVAEGTPLYMLDRVMRGIGRLAFPIFCFLLVEGFFHTSSKLKYALRLFGFALISEIPFDLAIEGEVLGFGYQNVFFTLLFALLTICALDKMKKAAIFQGSGERIVKALLTVPIMAAGMAAAYFLQTDYSFAGVLAVVVIYSLHEKRQEAMLGGCLVLTVYNRFEIFSLIDVILIKMYTGERGLRLKYIFYAFYPLHLLALYLIAVTLGVA